MSKPMNSEGRAPQSSRDTDEASLELVKGPSKAENAAAHINNEIKTISQDTYVEMIDFLASTASIILEDCRHDPTAMVAYVHRSWQRSPEEEAESEAAEAAEYRERQRDWNYDADWDEDSAYNRLGTLTNDDDLFRDTITEDFLDEFDYLLHALYKMTMKIKKESRTNSEATNRVQIICRKVCIFILVHRGEWQPEERGDMKIGCAVLWERARKMSKTTLEYHERRHAVGLKKLHILWPREGTAEQLQHWDFDENGRLWS